MRNNVFLDLLARKYPERPNRRMRRADRKLVRLYYGEGSRIGFARHVSKFRYLQAQQAARRARWEAAYMVERVAKMEASRSTFLRETPFQSPLAWLQKAEEVQ